MSVSWKKFFCIDLSKYRLITILWNSLPMIFKSLALAGRWRMGPYSGLREPGLSTNGFGALKALLLYATPCEPYA